MADDVSGIVATAGAALSAVAGAAVGYGTMRQRVTANEKDILHIEAELNDVHEQVTDRLARMETKLDCLIKSVDAECHDCGCK